MKKSNLLSVMMTLLMATFMSISFTACGSNDDNNGGNSSGTNPTTETLVVKVNNAELIFIRVPGGTYEFTISRKDSERNAFNVNLSGTMNDFYMSQTEVTNQLWKAVMGSIPQQSEQTGDKYPVIYNSYNDITKDGGFIDKLNELAKDQLPAGKKIALPTEEEWHYAAKGGPQSGGYKYAGSNSIDKVAWYYDNSDASTHPVAQKEPNELGLYDMSGNVWEFTSTLVNGKVANCGGGYTSENDWCELNLSFPDNVDELFENVGIRLVIK